MKKSCLLLFVVSGVLVAMEHKGPQEGQSKEIKKKEPVRIFDKESGTWIPVQIDVSKLPRTGNVVRLPGAPAPIEITKVYSMGEEQPILLRSSDQSPEARRMIQPLTYEGETGFNIALKKRESDEELKFALPSEQRVSPSTSRDISYMQALPEEDEEPTGGE